MLKPLLAGTAAVALLGTTLVFAQQQSAPGGPNSERRPSFSAEDRGAFLDARIAALKAGLKLTADQEKNWPAFEQAYREFGKVRGEQWRAFREREGDRRGQANSQAANPQAGNPIDRLSRRADAMSARGTALKRLADAAGPLYASLDEAQKARFQVLAREMRPHHHQHFAFWRERFRDQRDER